MTVEFDLVLGAQLEGIPVAEPNDGTSPQPPLDGHREPIRIPQRIELTQKNGEMTGIYTHPHWGSVPATDVSWSKNHIAFTAPSGNDDKDGETALFNFAFTVSDATDDVVGFACGTAPFYRSFLLTVGRITQREV